jgi:hypothetical protein
MCPRSNAIKASGKRVTKIINSSLISSAPGTDLRKNFVPMISVQFMTIMIAMLTADKIASHLVILVAASKVCKTKFLITHLLVLSSNKFPDNP